MAKELQVDSVISKIETTAAAILYWRDIFVNRISEQFLHRQVEQNWSQI